MKVTYLEPNHICQNLKCTKGKDGKQKHYYACDYCGWSENWRSICCSRECFVEKTEFEREAKMISPMRPVRTDMSNEEIEFMMNQTSDEVMKKTMEELSNYKESIDTFGLGAVIDIINEELDRREENDV